MKAAGQLRGGFREAEKLGGVGRVGARGAVDKSSWRRAQRHRETQTKTQTQTQTQTQTMTQTQSHADSDNV